MMTIGNGSTNTLLTEEEVYALCAEAFASRNFQGKRVLAIIPDLTRTAPIDLMFRIVYRLLADQVKLLDFVIALGTHQPLSEARINQRVGISGDERQTKYPKARFFNHQWDVPNQLQSIGIIPAEAVALISGGRMHQAVNVKLNKIVFDYDLLMIIGPTFPHEVVGFSGGNKYLFPGIAGQEIIDMFHWLGALITSPVIIGNKYTAVREVINKAVSFLPVERMCLSLVVKGNGLSGLYIGTPEAAWDAAADLSAQLHVIYKDRPFQKVLSRCPEMYEDLWTGGKCMYKLEPVVADGGELVIYAPHIKDISVTHGNHIERIGYHVRDYFVKQPDLFPDVPPGVVAHSTHVRGVGRFEDGVEHPRITVTLASQIPEDICRQINLAYRNPDDIDVDAWKHREEEGILYVPKAGEMLYRLKNDPFTSHVET